MELSLKILATKSKSGKCWEALPSRPRMMFTLAWEIVCITIKLSIVQYINTNYF